MFSLEGSILTSIAIDRFMVIGCPYIKTMRSKWWTCSSGTSELSSSQVSCADLQSKFSPTYASEDTHFSLAATPQEDFDPPRKSNRLEGHVATSRTSKNLGRQLCVLLPITMSTLAVTFFEVSVLLLFIKQRNSVDGNQPAVKLRYFVNRLYLISTLITFPLVCGPYICVFLAIRNYDKKRARLHKGRSNQPKRSLRTAMTLFIATLVFYLTLLPVLIFHFGNWTTDTGSNADLAKDAHMHPSAVYIHHEFYYINNAVNFFIYSWVSPAFRRRLKDLCKAH
nr:Orphan Rhodopsin-like G protein-coupled receptor [Hymenolepis microstoma]